MPADLLYFILLSLIFSAFFSGMEIAFISANKLQVELEREQEKFSAKLVSKFYKNPSGFIATMLIGNTLALSAYSVFMAKFLEPIFNQILPSYLNNDLFVLLFQTLAATVIVILTAEFLPKSIFLLNANKLLKVLAVPTTIIYKIMWIPVKLVVFLSKLVIRNIFKLKFTPEEPVFGLTDLNHYVEKMTSVADLDIEHEIDAKIFNNALEFKNVKVRECMIPRTELVAISIEAEIDELRKLFTDSGYSKILVYKESIDNIIGYCHSSQLFKKPSSIEKILSSLVVVPETLLANELLEQLIRQHKSVALVVDEFGGTAGIVTVEDVIEEIFGEIHDEHDDEELIEKQLSETEFLLSARHEIDYLNDKYNWELPEGEYETLGGLILDVYEDIPLKNKAIMIGEFRLTVQSKQKNRLENIKLELISQRE